MFFHSICLILQRKNFNFGRRLSFQRALETSSASNSMKFNQNHERANQEQNLDDSWNLIKSFAILGTMYGIGLFAHKYVGPESLHPLLNTEVYVLSQLSFNPLADAVEFAAPAVVRIEIKPKYTPKINWIEWSAPKKTSLASGFIVDKNGLILTNARAVNQPDTRIHVRLHDGREFIGEIYSLDPVTDLAIVRIYCSNLPTLKLGESSTLRAGQPIFFLKYLSGLKNTVTASVLSSPKRTSKELIEENGINYIQTDVPTTFGNSGGPLFNYDGKAIGVIAFGKTSIKGEPSIGFAIPSEYVLQFLLQSLGTPRSITTKLPDQ